ncbi:two-component system NarL family sensor kinase [Rossellomorea marisflavi]
MNEGSNIELLKEIAELLNTETEMESMMSEALNKLINGTVFTSGWVFFIDDQGKHEMVSHQNLPASLTERGCERMKEGGCWCVNRFIKGKLTKATNIIECLRIEKAIEEDPNATNDILYHATVPLQSGQESFGLLNMAAPHKTHYSHEELALLESVAFQIGSAIKRITLTKKEQELALIGERNRLARDLHDSVNQLLFSLTLTARGGSAMTDDQDVKDTFQTIQGMAQEALAEMRALIWQLKPHGLENGLVQAVRGYADMLGLKLDAEIHGLACLDSKYEEALWRVSQEALNNCKKHAGVQSVRYRLMRRAELVELIIEDDGYGFHYDPSNSLPSVGLQGMKERIKAVGGSLTIDTALGKGTVLSVKIPC